MNTTISRRVIVAFLFCITPARAEVNHLDLGFSGDWPPLIDTATSAAPDRLQHTRSRFQGVSQVSGNNYQDSSTKFPLVQLRVIGNERVSFLLTDPRRGSSDTTFSSLLLTGFVTGPALVTVFPNADPERGEISYRSTITNQASP